MSGRSQKVRVGSEYSSEKSVLSGIPQGSILGPVLFTIFINDLPECVSTACKIFADDTKLYNTTENNALIQQDLGRLQVWSDRWNLYFNVQKCKVMHIGSKNPKYEYSMKLEDNECPLLECEEEKDLGVIFDSKLSFDPHIQMKIGKANQMVGMIKRAFSYLDKDTFMLLYKAIIRPHLEYGQLIWYPYLKRQKIAIERVQRRATRMLSDCFDMTYRERLKYLQLPSLNSRRDRGDLIEMYKMYHGIIEVDFKNLFQKSKTDVTRNPEGKLFPTSPRTNTRKFSFAIRIISPWNALPRSLKFATNTNMFKNHLDTYPKFMQTKYDFDNY